MERHFTLVPHGTQELWEGYLLPSLRFKRGALLVDGKLEHRLSKSERERKVFWSRCIREGLFEHGVLQYARHGLSGEGVIALSSNADEEDVLSTSIHRVIPFRATNKPLVDEATDSLNMEFNADIWPTGGALPAPANPIAFGSIQFRSVQTGGDKGLSVPIITIPLLDQLLDAINQKLSSIAPDLQPIQSLYSSAVNLVEGTTQFKSKTSVTSVVTLTGAALIADIADQDAGTKLALTFKNKLESDLVLPILFEQFYVPQLKDGSLIGSIYEFDSHMRGSLGNRHLFNSVASVAAVDYSAKLNQAEDFGDSRLEAPAPVTAQLSNSAALSIEDLLSLPGYTDPVVHQATQDMIQNTMLYWMDTGVRENVLMQPNKPTDLPPALTTNLDGHIGSWIQNTYAPAYVANMLCYVDPDQPSDWRKQITQDEQIKIRYWWSGLGAKCLSQTELYNQLSQVAFTQAMLRLFPRLQYYQADPDGWAAELYSAMQDQKVLRSIQQTPFADGTNYANKLTNILKFLDIHNKFGDDLVQRFFGNSLSDMLQQPFIDNRTTSIADRATWMTDAFVELAAVAFGDTTVDPSGAQLRMSDDMQQSLQADLKSVEQALGYDSSADPRVRAQKLSLAYPGLMPALSAAMSPATKPIASDEARLATPVTDGESVDNNDDSDDDDVTWKTKFSLIQDRLRATLAKQIPGGTNVITGLTGVLSLVLFAELIREGVKSLSEWDEESATERAIIMLNVLSGAVSVVQTSWAAWLFFKSVDEPTFQANVVAYQLDESVWIEMQDVSTWLGKDAEALHQQVDTPMMISKISSKLHVGETPISTYETPEPEDNMNALSDELPSARAFDDAWESFATTSNLLTAIWTVLNIGVVISASIELAKQWNSLNDTGKALNVISISVTAIGVLVSPFVAEAVDMAALYITGALLINSTIMAALPGIGVVIAAVGLAFTFLLAFLNTSKPAPPPPPSPTLLFVENEIPALLNQWTQPPPNPRLVYTVPTTVAPGTTAEFQIRGENPTSSTLKIDSVTITFRSGTETACLFQDMNFTTTTVSDYNKAKDGKIFIDQADNCRVIISPTRCDDVTKQFDVKVTGIAVPATSSSDSASGTPLILGPTSGFRLNIAGIGAGGTTAMLQIVESLLDPTDSAFLLYNISK